MAEPVTKTSTAIAAIFGVVLSPIAGDWMMIVLGAVGGAFAEANFLAKPEEMRRWYQPPLRFAANVAMALVTTMAIARWLGTEGGDEHQYMALAAIVALFARHVIPAVIPAVVSLIQKRTGVK